MVCHGKHIRHFTPLQSTFHHFMVNFKLFFSIMQAKYAKKTHITIICNVCFCAISIYCVLIFIRSKCCIVRLRYKNPVYIISCCNSPTSYTLNRNKITSPSFTTYSLPSIPTRPFSLAADKEPCSNRSL